MHYHHFHILYFLFFLLLFSCNNTINKNEFSDTLTTPDELAQHTQEFKQEVLQVTNNVYVAVGFGLANSILIEGEDSVIIVDAMESMETGAAVKKAFAQITNKPVKAIIYTHNHTDHVFGASALAGDDQPDIYAHELMPYYLDRMATVVRDIIEQRSYRMFGSYLDEKGLVNCGIGPHLGIHKESLLGVIRPNITFKDSLKVTIAGVDLELFHVPGETNDQINVWLPQQEVLLCGDNLYRTFPNLYTIRGTPYRDVNLWKASIDKIRQKQPEYIIPSHTRPLKGKAAIQQILTNYRDGIQFVHDQTVRYMNKGWTPEEIVEKVKLPKHLAQSPFLKELYGTVAWSVRSIFNGYLGPFSGNPVDLNPLPPLKKAQKMAQLAGGEPALNQQLEQAIANEEYQWALELSGYLLRLQPQHPTAKQHQIKALTQLGTAESNPNARHYYLTYALELNGLENGHLAQPSVDMVHHLPMSAIFNGMATRLIAEKCLDVEKTVIFQFPDTKEQWTVHIRKGVAEVQPFAFPNPDITITVHATVWKEIAAKLQSPAQAFLTGEIGIDGGKLELLNFLGLFEL